MYPQSLKKILTLFDFGSSHIKCYPVPSTSCTKFEVATSNGLGGDTLTGNMTVGRTDGQTDGQTEGRTTHPLRYAINIPFKKKEAGIISMQCDQIIQCCSKVKNSFY